MPGFELSAKQTIAITGTNYSGEYSASSSFHQGWNSGAIGLSVEKGNTSMRDISDGPRLMEPQGIALLLWSLATKLCRVLEVLDTRPYHNRIDV